MEKTIQSLFLFFNHSVAIGPAPVFLLSPSTTLVKLRRIRTTTSPTLFSQSKRKKEKSNSKQLRSCSSADKQLLASIYHIISSQYSLPIFSSAIPNQTRFRENRADKVAGVGERRGEIQDCGRPWRKCAVSLEVVRVERVGIWSAYKEKRFRC